MLIIHATPWLQNPIWSSSKLIRISSKFSSVCLSFKHFKPLCQLVEPQEDLSPKDVAIQPLQMTPKPAYS